MKTLITSLFILIAVVALPQSDSLQRQINEQVWKPFIKGFSTSNNELFSSVHSKDVMRVMQDNENIIGYEEYFRPVPDSIKAKWGKWKQQIELRFIQRIAAGDKAFETGYYKTTSTNEETNEIRTGYGKFHVLLRKENNVWKILMDAYAYENTDEKVFLSAKPME